MNNPTRIETALAARSLEAMRAEVHAPGGATTMLHARALTAHAHALAPTLGQVRVAIIHTYTSEALDPWFNLAAALEGFDVAVHHAPYGLALGEARTGSALVEFCADLTLLLLQPGDLDPALAYPIAALGTDERTRLADTATRRFIDILTAFRGQPVGRLIATLLPSPTAPDLGFHDAVSEAGEGAFWADVKARLARATRETLVNTSLLDLDGILADLGREAFFDRRTWYSARNPFSARAACELARRVVALGVIAKRPRLKVIALDADNTLWGGVIGEDGIEGIALGPDYPGNCYMDFQRRILGLQQRGFILALCSKNNPADVEQVLREHPHMLLRAGHFAATRVNWRPKIDNLNELAEELALGIDSFLLVDDSDYECAAVRRELPQVEVVKTPDRPVDVPGCLDKVSRLEILSLTAEDRRKTAIYSQERERRELRRTSQGEGVDLASYLKSLDMRMTIGIDDVAQLKRLAQLTQKTNQFNLTTRRYDEAQMRAMIEAPDWTVAHFSLADSFGDSGLVGLALIHRPEPGHARVDGFLMSCRVIGREAEAAFLHALLRRLAADGIDAIEAEYLPTPKNALAKEFLASQDFTATNAARWHRDLRTAPPRPAGAFPITVDA